MNKINEKIIIGASMSLISVPVGLFLIKKNSIGERIAKKAEEYLNQNIIEIKENRGWNNDEFERKMRMVGWREGYEWCAYFSKLVLIETFAEARLKRHWTAAQKLTGSSQYNWKYFISSNDAKLGLWRFEDKPRRGDLIFFRRTDEKSKGHVGIVSQVSGKSIKTIEGNANDRISLVNRTVDYDNPQGKFWLLGFIRFQRG